MAEWAQLRGATTARSGLERGMWYRVQARGRDGAVRVIGPDGEVIDFKPQLVRVIDHEPDTMTRIQESEFHQVRPGEPAPAISFYGHCPRGHWVRSVPTDAAELPCPQCDLSYRVEDEIS